MSELIVPKVDNFNTIISGMELVADVLPEFVLSGTAALELLLTSPQKLPIRPICEIELLVPGLVDADYNAACRRLLRAEFTNLGGKHRRYLWTKGKLSFQIIPATADARDGGNAWHQPGILHAKDATLPNGKKVQVITSPFFIASRMADFQTPDRDGYRDFIHSRYFSEIIVLMDGRPELAADIRAAREPVAGYLQRTLAWCLSQPKLLDAIALELPRAIRTSDRADNIINRWRACLQPAAKVGAGR